MSHPAQTGTGLGLTIAQAGFLALASLIAFLIGADYLINGSVSFSYGMIPCCGIIGFLGGVLLLGSTVLNVISAVMINRKTESKMCQRAFFVFILYPILLVSFIIPAWEELFYTSLIFGFPVFIAGVILLPLFSFFLLKESLKLNKSAYVISTCSYCRFPFRRRTEAVDAVCPRCGAYNRFLSDGSDQKELTTEEYLRPSGEMDWGTDDNYYR